MKARYLGKYYSHIAFIDDVEDEVYLFTSVDDEDDYYDQELFMKTNKESLFDAVSSETNTSAIACKIVNGDLVKLWRIW